MKIDLSLIEDICGECSGASLYSLDNIPKIKLKNAVQYFPLTEAKKVFMLYDSTIFGSCRNGIAVCDNGVFYRCNFNEPKYSHFTWEEFLSLNIYAGKKSDIFFGDKHKVFVAGNSKNILVECFKKIQYILSNEDKDTESISIADVQKNKLNENNIWMLAADGKQYGPMNEEEIEKKLIEKFFTPEFTFVWKQGMNKWEVLTSVSEFASMLQRVNFNVTPPPLPNIFQSKIIKDNEKIDINNCELEELLVINSISLQRANHLIEMRYSGKKFYSAEDIGTILDLKPHEVEEIKDKVIFNIPKVSRGVRRVEF